MAHHRPQGEGRRQRRRPLRLPRLHRHLVRPDITTPSTTPTKVFTITDRPVYRPEQKVQFKAWIEHAKYDQADNSAFADQAFPVRIHNPRARKSSRRTSRPTTTAAWPASSRCPRASCSASTRSRSAIRRQPNLGGGNFRVEEYKKPEFEVRSRRRRSRCAWARRSRHHQGEVLLRRAGRRSAKVKYKVLRTSYSNRWYPTRQLGLVLRRRLLVVRRRLSLVSRLARVGLQASRAHPGGAADRNRRRSCWKTRSRSAPTAP